MLALPVAAALLLGVPGRPAPGATAAAREDGRVARVAGQALAAIHELQEERVRAVAGDRLEWVDRTLGQPGVRTIRGLELALLQPTAGPPAAVDHAAWRHGLADRSAALRRVAGELAGDLDAAARTWLERQERRLRDRLALAAAVVLAILVAALVLGRGSAAGAGLGHGHGFAVRLGPSPQGGVTATVRLPATVLPARAVAALGRGQGAT